MITCPKCGKDNQPHYKFCLGCGAELPRDGAPKPFVVQTPAGGVPKQAAPTVQPSAPSEAPPAATAAATEPVAAMPTQQPAPPVVPAYAAAPAEPPRPRSAAPAAAAPIDATAQLTCSQCGHLNSAGSMFCASCGFRIGSPAAQPVAAAPAAAPAVATANVTVVLTALRADGSESGTYTLPGAVTPIGRESGSIFAADSYLSPRHATFTIQGQRVLVKDEQSLNGVYRRLQRDAPVELHPNDIFRIGQEIIKFEPLTPPEPSPDGVERLGAPARGYIGRIALVIGRETIGNAFPMPESGMHLGRERGDVLFPEDGYVSGLHCRLAHENGKTYLTDLGSSNGTFLRIKEETELTSGDILLMGQQLFRVNF